MKQENNSISVGISGLYRFFFSLFEKKQIRANAPITYTDPIAAEGPQISEGEPAGANKEVEAGDPYLDAYSYLYLYWFI